MPRYGRTGNEKILASALLGKRDGMGWDWDGDEDDKKKARTRKHKIRLNYRRRKLYIFQNNLFSIYDIENLMCRQENHLACMRASDRT